MRRTRGAVACGTAGAMNPTGPRPAVIVLSGLLIVSLVTAAAATVAALRRFSSARAERPVEASVPLVRPPEEPIAAEAEVFRTRAPMLAIEPADPRQRSAHPRTLRTFRFLRAYPGAPPRVPHGLAASEYRSTSCLACHARGGYSLRFAAYAPVTPHPERAMCLQCHLGVDAVMGFASPGAEASERCHLCHGKAGGPPRPEASSIWATTIWPTLPAPASDQSPPPIPHDLQFRENCLACHSGPAAVAEIRTAHPDRADCRQCHVVGSGDVAAFTHRSWTTAPGTEAIP